MDLDRRSRSGLSPRIRSAVIGVAVAWATVGGVPAQTTLGVPGLVAPGVPFPVTLTNNSPLWIDMLAWNLLTLMQPDGEVVFPELVGCGWLTGYLPTGASATLTWTVPASGPGSAGSFLLLCPYGSGAAARLDVGAPSAGYPDIHAYPTAMPFGVGPSMALPNGRGAHHLGLPPHAGSEWEFSNTAAVARVISPTIRIFAPGGTTPATVASFPNLTVPAGGVARVALPLAGLPAGPWTVEAGWFDPGLGGPHAVRHGLGISGIPAVDLHFPGGRTLAPGGTIPARFGVNQASAGPSPPWPYALLVGFQPGSTPLPGGALVPLVADALVSASFTNGLGGLLTGNLGATVPAFVFCWQSGWYFPVAGGIGLTHPGVASVSGAVVRVAVVALDPVTAAYASSQPEEIRLL